MPMEPTGFFLHQVTVNCSSSPDRKLERKLHDAIRKQNLEKVRSILNSSKLPLDLNLVDSLGKTLLQVAGELKYVSIRNAIIKALLSEGADLQIALLYAVRNNNASIVKILLQFDKEYTQESLNTLPSSKSQGYTTPLFLAAWMQNFQIVKLLLDHGFTIGDSSNTQWHNDSNGMAGERLEPAMCRLNKCRARASPVYISASFLQDEENSPNPFHRACDLNKELRETAEQEYELRKEYLELSDGCKKFAVALLNECRSMEEIRCIMETKFEDRAFNMLEFAVFTRNETFVSHPYSQLILTSEVYKGASFLEKNPWKQSVVSLLASVLLFMFLPVFYVCFPNRKVARMFHSPRVRFLIHCGSYQTFLSLLAFTSARSDLLTNTVPDWFVVSFVIGLLVDVIRNVYQLGRIRFFSYRFNYTAVATVTFFVIHYIIWWVGRAMMPDNLNSVKELTEHPSYKVMLFSECFLIVGIFLAFVHNFSFIQGISSTGPMLHAFVEMLIDVAKFFLYFTFIFMTFAVSFTKLYLQYQMARNRYLQKQAPVPNRSHPLELERLEMSMAAMFWSLFGDLKHQNFEIEEEGYDALSITGLVLFAAFKVVAVLVALKMLIAILKESYTRISGRLDTEWKFTRTKLWLSWIYKKGVLPPPYNVLYMLLPVCWVVNRLASACCPETQFLERFIKDKPRKTRKDQRNDKKKRRVVIRNLILRYLAHKGCHVETGTESSDSNEEGDKETAGSHTINEFKIQQTSV